ncbi:MAG: DUF805 domain-containing protein [Mesorhizobium sp.]|uniref:DUF805 domain-containing protein n=1 Tax=Mesorhizobium sp. TaxID=1871066 RepID=UPI001215E227|nr:DUF805 domain-containing protein [Mesorhizobium sp.]TIP75229.1 MAG: DUF805 domain-containing protein [Mesorhizobium sp.]TIQ11680.1 MAG: DUF805 domain-containing protein [Mesorhizobium sp.]TIR52726.1 MAG: DUF805 domain-containing protein [Mesorhizobium sp.]TJV98528.1 MAG: DUF805 domain-containing protein [Mesorhizobium sp.]
MRGTVYHYDQDQDFGYINGVDGKRYIFAREDLNQGVALVRGTLVEFRPDDGTAHDIIAAASPAGGMPTPGSGQPQHFGRLAETEPVEPTGLWSYFRRALTENHVNFAGRARRKEFWAFWLCSTLVAAALVGFGILVNLAIDGFDDPGRTRTGYIPGLIFALLITLPWIALVVRRLHYIGLSGWFALLCFIPPIGGVAILVFGLIPSQTGENPWGAMPAGVRI